MGRLASKHGRYVPAVLKGFCCASKQASKRPPIFGLNFFNKIYANHNGLFVYFNFYHFNKKLQQLYQLNTSTKKRALVDGVVWIRTQNSTMEELNESSVLFELAFCSTNVKFLKLGGSLNWAVCLDQNLVGIKRFAIFVSIERMKIKKKRPRLVGPCGSNVSLAYLQMTWLQMKLILKSFLDLL